MLAIRPEAPADHAAVAALIRAAFGRPQEAELVERLRAAAAPQVSLVAADDAAVVGHVFFSPVTIDGAPRPAGTFMGLAPLAVVPARQRSGIGGALVRAGLEACRRGGAAAVVVLGHREYYPRFGFVAAVRFALRDEYGGGDSFMALELTPGALAGVSGLVRYLPELAAV